MLGRLIGNIRAERGISQEKLADGICKKEILKKYESGEIEPEKLLTDALMQRLGRSMDGYNARLEAAEYKRTAERAWIQALLRRGKLERAEAAISKYAGMLKADMPLHRQFIQLQWAELLRRKGAERQEQMRAVEAGLRETFGEKELSVGLFECRKMHLMELFLLERYAILLEETGKCQTALLWYERMLKVFDYEKRDLRDKAKVYPLAAYRTAMCYEKQERFPEAVFVVRRGMELLEDTDTQSTLLILMKELEQRTAERSGYPVAQKEKEWLSRVREIAGRNETMWRENWYPVYFESHISCVTDMLRERRHMLGLSRADMAEGVCDVRTLERIEKGKSRIHKKVRKGLSKKLGLPVQKYDGGIVTSRYDDCLKYEKMQQDYFAGRISEAGQLYHTLVGRLDRELLVNCQFEKYWGSLLLFSRGEITREEKNRRLWTLLGEDFTRDAGEGSFGCQLTEYERAAFLALVQDCGFPTVDEAIAALRMQCRGYRGGMLQCGEPGYYGVLLNILSEAYYFKGDYRRAGRYNTAAMGRMCMEAEGAAWSRILLLKFLIEEKQARMNYEKERMKGYERLKWLEESWAAAELYRNRFMQDFFRICFEKDDATK